MQKFISYVLVKEEETCTEEESAWTCKEIKYQIVLVYIDYQSAELNQIKGN